MDFKLTKPFAANSAVDEYDVKQIKKALNRLGYYQPFEKVGITDIPDTAVFDALKAFQKDQGLNPTGTAKPDDETVQKLSAAVRHKNSGKYIWRTVGDSKVRAAHAKLNRTLRDFSDSPDLGDDYNCRCWAEPLSNTAKARKNAILNRGVADFSLKPDLHPVSKKPWYASDKMSEVNYNKLIIEEEAAAAGVNADLIKAIIYVETTQGYYDAIHPWNKSIRPMNIQTEYWKELGYSREQLITPRLNIRAGIELVKRIKSLAPNASISEIATLYNGLDAKRINDYGARVARVMKEKPWIKKK